MTKLIVRIIAGINILVGIPLLLAYLAPKVSPASHWIFAFLGLAYPVLVAIQLFFSAGMDSVLQTVCVASDPPDCYGLATSAEYFSIQNKIDHGTN